jgi:NADPH-dependent ferric siderophore reductase
MGRPRRANPDSRLPARRRSGSAWILGVEPGDECDLFGPRASLDVRQTTGPLAIFGDETSIGLAYALARHDPARSVACHFEVGNVESCKQVVARLGIGDTVLFARSDDDAHLAALEATLPALIATGASFVLTGKAGTIQQLRQSLKRQAVGTKQIVTKAYWAPGKVGLD